MSGSGKRSDGDCFGCIPSLNARREHKRQPMSGNCRMKKRHAKARERDGGENGLIHGAEATREASGWWDLNPRPLRPERSALPS